MSRLYRVLGDVSLDPSQVKSCVHVYDNMNETSIYGVAGNMLALLFEFVVN